MSLGGDGTLTVPVAVSTDALADLEKIAAAIDKVGTSSEKVAKTTAEFVKDFDKLAKSSEKIAPPTLAAADAIDKLGDAAKKTEEKTKGAEKSSIDLAKAFNTVHEFAANLTSRITALADGIAGLATEQESLNRQSARLGLDFDAGSAAAGRFADETTAMAAATRLFETGTRLSQDQLNALMRVAGEFSQTTGTTVASAVDQLTSGLITGSERGLRPFGASMSAVAGDAHTMEERLAALVDHAGHVETAVDSAADRMERFRDMIGDGMRTAASAFVTSLDEIGTRANAAEERITGVRTETADLKDTLTALGSTAAYVWHLFAESANSALTQVATRIEGVAGAASMMARVIANPSNASAIVAEFQGAQRGRAQDRDAATARLNSVIDGPDPNRATAAGPGLATADSASTRARFSANEGGDENVDVTLGGTARTGGGHRDDHRKTAKSAALAAQAAEREREMLQLRATRDLATEILRIERDRERLSRESADAIGEQVTHANELARINSRIASLQDESVVDAEVGVERARSRQGRAQGRVNRRATLEDLRDPGVQQERAADAAQSRAVAREERLQQRRLDSMQSFTERWRDLHEQQVDSTQVAAEMLSNTFSSMGDAMRKHVEAAAEGRETAGEAVRGILADTLDALGKEAMIKGTLYAAEGLAALARYDFGGAATAFAASAAFIGAGALIGYAGSQVAPASPAAAPSAASGSSAGSSRVAGSSRPSNDNAAPATVNHFYAPVIGGRTASDAEVGGRMNRFTDATARRQLRARA